ncbi:hypothetical protein BDR03DRAFT_947921 [Suillus americanus]|nr:hypothetical protein BDR03DRAFT_947921 [Suillus americanus]
MTTCALTSQHQGRTIPQTCISVFLHSPDAILRLSYLSFLSAFSLSLTGLIPLLSPTLVFNVLHELFFFVSLLAKSQSGYSDYNFR